MARKQNGNQPTGNKAEFLTGLRSHITVLKGDNQNVGEDIRKAQEEGRVATDSRRTVIAELVTNLLPDLDISRLEGLRKVLTFAPSAADAHQLRQNAKNLLDKEQARACPGFNLSTYETALATLDSQIGVHDAKQTKINEILSATPDLERLYGAGYGTSKYYVSVFSLAYYYNWNRADEIVDALKMESWSDVLAYVKELDSQRASAISEVRALRVVKFQLENAREAYLDIEKRRQEIDVIVLEKLQVELRASLDAFDGPTPVIAGQDIVNALFSIRSFAGKVAKAEDRIRTELQPARQSLTAEIGKLETLYAAAEKSRAQNIPTDFVGMTKQAELRASDFLRGGSGPVRVEHHYHNNSGTDFTTYLMYDALLSHLNTSAPAPVVVREAPRTPGIGSRPRLPITIGTVGFLNSE